MLFRHPIAAPPIAATLFAGPSFAQVIVVTAPAPAFAAVAYDYTDAAGIAPGVPASPMPSRSIPASRVRAPRCATPARSAVIAGRRA